MIVTGPAAFNKSGARSSDVVPPPNTLVGTDTPVILDSNVWIDLLVFADAIVQPIRDALDAGTLHVVIDDACLRELRYVLLYPQFARFAVDHTQALARTAAWTHAVTSIADGAEASVQPVAVPGQAILPKCSDRDDQKFLALAAATGAQWLVTKDKALLKLHRRMLRDFNCHVVLPAAFTAQALGTR